MPVVPFIGPSYEYRSRDVSYQRSVNLYPEVVDSKDTKSDYVLVGTPGSTTFKTLPKSNCKGLYWTSTERLFAVYGNTLYEVDSDGTTNVRGTLTTTNKNSYMVDNGTYLLVVASNSMYSLKLSDNTWANVTLPFSNPKQIVYVNGRAVCSNESNQFFWSDLGDEGIINWDALSFASAEGSADNIIAISNTDGNLWLFGPRSYEVWRSTTNPDLPFARMGGSFTDIGCGADQSPQSISGQVFWLGSSKAGRNQVFMGQGSQAIRISNHAIEYQLDQISESTAGTTADARCFCYQQAGHTFYVMNFISGDQTWVYDVTTKQWHERTTRDPNLNTEKRWAPIFATFAHDKVLVGNYDGPEIIELKMDVYSDYNGAPIIRERTSPVYWQENKLMFYRSFQLDMETGIGLPTGQGSDPEVSLAWSDDGGYTWSSEYTRTAGRQGKYLNRVFWRMLGRSRERVFRVRISDPVKVVLIGANVVAEKGTFA